MDRIEKEKKMRDRGQRKLSFGTDRKVSKHIEMIESVQCASFYIVNREEKSST